MSKTLPKSITSCIASKFPASRAHPMLFAALAGVMVANAIPPTPTSERDQLEELRQKLLATHNEMSAIAATAAEDKGRMFTAEEQSKLDKLSEDFETLEAEIDRRERLIAQRERLEQPQERKVKQPAEPRASITGGDKVGVTKGMWGWESFGAWSAAVKAAGTNSGVDKRLAAAATTYGSEGANADGGFAVPPDFRTEIVKKIQADTSLLARCDQQTTSSNKLTVPLDNTAPHETSGGIQAEWEGEASAGTPSKPSLAQLEVKANKLKALVPMTDELLEDAPSLSRYLPGKVADKFTQKINTAIVTGNGTGMPLGLLNSPSKIKVDQEDDQEADTIVFMNIAKMWARLHAMFRPGAIWLANQDIEPQLIGMIVPGTNGVPAYLPPGGLSASPYGTLMGRPVVPVEACKALGDEGDLILTNLSSYLAVTKTTGIKQDVSIHAYFEQALTAFRFILRMGGQSWWSAPMARENGSNTLSNIVTLEDRTGA